MKPNGIDAVRIALFRSLFHGREDIYARYWQSATNEKRGYAPVYRLNNQSEPLTDRVIHSHLSGEQTIGIYPLLPNNTTYFLAIDFDGPQWLAESTKVHTVSSQLNLPCYSERSRSGDGGHLWFFFETAIPAWKARQLGKLLLHTSHIVTRKTFDRMFPSQDEHTGKGFGNLIALPLQWSAVTHNNTVFLDPSGTPYPDQWHLLQSVNKISPASINALLHVPQSPPALVQRTQQPPVSAIPDEPEDTVRTTETQEVRMTIASQIYIPELYLPDSLYKFLKSKLNFPNPQFQELVRRGYSTWKTPRMLFNIDRVKNGIMVPNGFLFEIEEFAKEHNLSLHIENRQIITKPIRFPTTLTLRPEQHRIATQLLAHDRGILEAHPAFGKTMVALYCMKRRKQKTLVIVHTMALLQQWKKRIEEWFTLTKDDIGIIGGNKWTIGKKITIASYQTLARRGVNDIENIFGHVIVDECHHVPAHTFTNVVKQLSARYVLGLTATAFRKDQLDRLMTFYIGPIIKTHSAQTETPDTTRPPVETKLITRKTTFQRTGKSQEFSDLAAQLIADEARNQLISADVASAIRVNAKCLVLTDRVEHCQTFLATIRNQAKGVQGAIAEGNMTKKKREQLMRRIRQERFQLLIATGKLIGEGFDWPELTYLFLAFPFSWKGKLVQYVGRVQRSTEVKTTAFVYDYVDFDVPMLKIMYFKRLRTYRTLGLTKEKPRSSKHRASENQIGLF